MLTAQPVVNGPRRFAPPVRRPPIAWQRPCRRFVGLVAISVLPLRAFRGSPDSRPSLVVAGRAALPGRVSGRARACVYQLSGSSCICWPFSPVYGSHSCFGRSFGGLCFGRGVWFMCVLSGRSARPRVSSTGVWLLDSKDESPRPAPRPRPPGGPCLLSTRRAGVSRPAARSLCPRCPTSPA